MKTIKDIAVGIQENADLSTINFPLGFVVPGVSEQNHKKRWETVISWVRGWSRNDTLVHKHEFENSFIEGFKLDSSVSRYNTQNKLFRIKDPRGFMFEISADNLVDLIKTAGIEKGTFMGKYALAMADNGKVCLIREDHPDIILNQIVNSNNNRTDNLVPGQAFQVIGNSNYFSKDTVVVFLKKMYVVKYAVDVSYKNHKSEIHNVNVHISKKPKFLFAANCRIKNGVLDQTEYSSNMVNFTEIPKTFIRTPDFDIQAPEFEIRSPSPYIHYENYFESVEHAKAFYESITPSKFFYTTRYRKTNIPLSITMSINF